MLRIVREVQYSMNFVNVSTVQLLCVFDKVETPGGMMLKRVYCVRQNTVDAD